MDKSGCMSSIPGPGVPARGPAGSTAGGVWAEGVPPGLPPLGLLGVGAEGGLGAAAAGPRPAGVIDGRALPRQPRVLPVLGRGPSLRRGLASRVPPALVVHLIQAVSSEFINAIMSMKIIMRNMHINI
ncbi:unnamed protein product [Nezara viridula]|uniref:Uncharacterized protein n=1 Tax=Nezara viridula TaxID=85310 RepID=A0A9P0E4W2_NEZVI|nr:unnamed protein product [Nezara viridula]